MEFSLAFVAVCVLIFGFAIAVAMAIQAIRTMATCVCSFWSNGPTTAFNAERATTQTFNLLTSAMLVFCLIALTWAIGAGVMRTAWIYTQKPKGLVVPLDIATFSGAVGFLWFLVLQIFRAVGGTLAIGVAAGLAGAIIGFIFGVPSQISATATPPAGAGGTVPAAGVNQQQAANAWRLSTNLTQISTWLTSAIIGVSLVEAKSGATQFLDGATLAAGWLFDLRHGSPAVLAAVMFGSAVFGFLYCYLYAELIISRLIVAVDQGIQSGLATAKQTLTHMATTKESLVPRISRSRHVPESWDEPKPAEIEAAFQYISISYEEMMQRNASADDLRSWARAKAVLNDYRAAAQGYVHLLGMK